MKKATVVVLILVALCAVAYGFEWRYSDDMQQHIASVDSQLETARLNSLLSRGLLASIQSMTDEANIAREIIDTHEHVHTLKDEMLARKIKQAVSEGVTVGGAMQRAISVWQDRP